ncbi:MAG TPA: asparagine synthase (glutamine-hydrolyzing) [Hanamia sp.]|nr:asparagine synthase (glutamine-hydrolyzing) [Hanamia sp.]
MCGIAGRYHFYPSISQMERQSDIKKMLSVIRHRGPDESGIYVDEHVGLGSVRLSIIDIASGQQPMSDESGEYWIVYNGEIFNYQELRKDLEKKGVKLKTNCDTEVVVQMYALYGSECLQYFNGQFAFCIWNEKKQELFLARDRVGIRPLFYWKEADSFAFCSEIKGLFTLNEIERSVNRKSLAQIFTFWTTISPNTPFENIYELPPGHFMIVKPSGINIQKYWSLDFPVNGNHYRGDLNEAVEEFRDLLKDAVRIRLRADVQVAAYLSGGLDSSVITSLIKEINPGVLNTFSIGFEDKIFDESAYQQQAVKYFNTNHTAFECTSEEIAEQFLNTIWHTEFPILRTAPTPMFLLSKKVRERNIKVVMTGEGSDEILAGYNIFKEAKIRRFWASQPASSIRPKLLSKLYPYLPMLKDGGNLGAKMFFGYKLTETSDPLYSHLLRWHNTSRITTFFSDEINEHLNGYNPLEEVSGKLPANFSAWTPLAQSQYLESSIFMSGYLLSSQGDRMAMGNSVEGRYPFLDYRVIEFCSKLPDRFKLNCLNEKFLLKKMSSGKIPESITKRSKQPYRAPITTTFFNTNSPSFISEILSENSINCFHLFNAQKVNSLINKVKLQKNVTEVDQMAITGILSAQLLQKMFAADRTIPTTDLTLNTKVIKKSRSGDFVTGL